MASFDIGDVIHFTATFTNAAGTPADPTGVTFKLRLPLADTASYTTLTTPAVVKDSTGHYHIDIAATASGAHFYRWEGDGAVTAAGESVLTVNPSNV